MELSLDGRLAGRGGAGWELGVVGRGRGGGALGQSFF